MSGSFDSGREIDEDEYEDDCEPEVDEVMPEQVKHEQFQIEMPLKV